MSSILTEFSELLKTTFSIVKENRIVDPTTGNIIVSGDPIVIYANKKGCMYSKSMAEKYFANATWLEDVDYVLVTVPLSNIDNKMLVVVDSVLYPIDYIDDVAFFGEVMLIGLRNAI